MINGVTLMGLVDGDVRVQGPTGPVTISPEPAAPLVAFRVNGWEPNGTPDGLADERQGHKVLGLMEDVGQAMADDRIDAQEIGTLSVAFQLPGGRVISGLIPVTQQVVDALEDDGRVDTKEALAIVGSIISVVLSRAA